MWLKVAEQMAAPWRLADAMHQETGKHAFAHQADMSASSEDRSRDAATNLLSQASNLPELRMPIEKDTTLLPSFAEMFSDVPSTHSAPN
ncbi:MYB DNA-binding domain-containing protein [Penicillium atrosanguineum]|uniref:MYB DNA-binding domain-containing protein n=1 Tax=Penicillium atrosanguineum TaxID=1132637 RepID=A0A9W9KT74_9EURO|nr:MYB DNA-binding domain-containing protein [Penicillium atrosanguineum]KAJ5117786.1 MYB DNA-binding domain-containing protein [Penicillium atrosanguineum]KAJ5318736.1 MYB DNA-binding domain-containing protein [Penicillium atrosanguineum]